MNKYYLLIILTIIFSFLFIKKEYKNYIKKTKIILKDEDFTSEELKFIFKTLDRKRSYLALSISTNYALIDDILDIERKLKYHKVLDDKDKKELNRFLEMDLSLIDKVINKIYKIVRDIKSFKK